jgi:hypothetical protein
MSSPPATEGHTNHLYNYLIIYLDLHHLINLYDPLLFPAKYLLRINSLAMIAMEIFCGVLFNILKNKINTFKFLYPIT